MQQFVSVFVVAGEEGRQLFQEASERLSDDGFRWDRDGAIERNQLAYWNQFLDVWSMGDSFERFLQPDDALVFASSGIHQLICARRELLKISRKARNEEEVRLKEILTQANRAYRKATDESYLFLVRSVFAASDGFVPDREGLK